MGLGNRKWDGNYRIMNSFSEQYHPPEIRARIGKDIQSIAAHRAEYL
jgi:hypothetical protein